MTRPATCSPAFDRSRQWAAACRVGAKWPFRCTSITASHSRSSMLTSMRSRRIPALLTRMSRRPNAATAPSIRRFAPAKSATFSPSAIAAPPSASISRTTSCAGPVSAPSPASDAPRSFTTILAPACASARACSRPIPRPAPVTTATFPSSFGTSALLQKSALACERASDDELLDLARSFVQRCHARVTQVLADRIFVHVTVAAVHLHGRIRGADRDLARVVLRNRGLDRVTFAGVCEQRRPPRQESGRLELDGHVHKQLLHELERRDRFAELLSLTCIFDARIEAALGDADATRRQGD